MHTKYIHALRNILWETLDAEQPSVTEAHLMRKIFFPHGLEMPDREDMP